MAVARLYDGMAIAWDSSVALVYRPLASSLVQASPVPLDGKLVLDLGSGTGPVAQALVARGARVVVADCSLAMVVPGYQRGWMAIAADALAVPVRKASFDAVAAGFLLNHVPPTSVLAEMARVVRAGGAVFASTWASVRSDPVKAAVAEVLRSWGWRPPAWYESMKTALGPVSGDPQRLTNAAEEVGLVDVHAAVVEADLQDLDAPAVVAYRLAMPQIAPWVAGLGEPATSQLVRQACRAAFPYAPGWRPSVIHLTARVPAHPR